MSLNKKILLWIGLIITITLGALWQFYPLPDAQDRLDTLPLQGETFQGKDSPLTDFEKHAFKEVNLIKRIYQAGSQKCFLTVLDGTHNRHIVHDPFYCFRGSGWKLLSKKQIPIDKGHATLLKMRRGIQRREALVWFSDGQKQHASAMTYFVQTTLRRLTLGYSGEEPLLIVIQPLNTQTLNWKALINDIPDLQKL